MLIMPYFNECQILGNMQKNPQSLMLITVMKHLQKLGYVLKVSGSYISVSYYLSCW